MLLFPPPSFSPFLFSSVCLHPSSIYLCLRTTPPSSICQSSLATPCSTNLLEFLSHHSPSSLNTDYIPSPHWVLRQDAGLKCRPFVSTHKCSSNVANYILHHFLTFAHVAGMLGDIFLILFLILPCWKKYYLVSTTPNYSSGTANELLQEWSCGIISQFSLFPVQGRSPKQ